MASMHVKAIDVIKKPPHQRSKAEVELIAPWLRKQTHLLQGLELAALLQIVKNCDYLKTGKDEILIRQGDKGDCLYIILLGVVSVYVDQHKTVTDYDDITSSEPKPKAKTSQVMTSSGREESGGRSNSNQSALSRKPERSNLRKAKVDRSKFGKLVVKFDEGKCFGEIALISEDSRRNATIITEVETDLLVIRKELYDSTLKEHQEKEFDEKRRFARKHPLFKNWDKRLHKILEMSLVKEVYTFGAQMIKQGDPFSGLIFILKGRARVLVEPSRHNQQYEDHFPFAEKNDIYAVEFNRPQKKAPEHPEEILRWEHIEIRRTEGYAAAEKRRFHREIPLCIVEEGEIVGDIECVCNLNTHTISAVCMAPTEVFTLSMKNLERLTKKVPRTMDVLKMEVETKLQNRLQTKQGSEVFLYRHLFFKLTEEIPISPRKSPDFGVGIISKRLPDREVLFQHLMTTFMENKSQAVIPHVEGSIFLRERMREKARLRDTVKENTRSREGHRKYRKTTLRRPPSAKPRSIKHLKLALKKQEDSAQQTEREYLAREYRTLEKQVMKEFYLNSLANLSVDGKEEEGIKILCGRLHKAGVHLSALPKPSLVVGTSKSNENTETVATEGNGTETKEHHDNRTVTNENEVPRSENPNMTSGETLSREKTFVTEFNRKEEDMELQKQEDTAAGGGDEQNDQEDSQADSQIQEETQGGSQNAETEPKDATAQSTSDAANLTSVEEATAEGDSDVPVPVLQIGRPDVPKTPVIRPPLNAATEAIIAREAVLLEASPRIEIASDVMESARDEHESPLMTSQSFKQLQHVRSLISNKIELSTDDPQYRDWETSQTSLDYLERRIKNFKINREPTFVRLPPLQRFESGDEKKEQPKPGGRVIIQRKRCNAENTGKNVPTHAHIRRHVISKVPDYSKLRHHKMLTHFVLDDARDKWISEQQNTKGSKKSVSRRQGSRGTLSVAKGSMVTAPVSNDRATSIGQYKTLPSITSSRN